MESTKERFEQNYGMPGCLGGIDGTHIALSAVRQNLQRAYLNRKKFHSLNVQVVCDDRLLFTNLNARFAGSNHDAHIFLGSRLRGLLANVYEQSPNELNYLIGG